MEFLTATRQFDAAYEEVLKELKRTAPLPLGALDLERGAKLGLSIAVRVKQDTGQALKLSEALKNSKNVSPFMKEAAENWQRDIHAWKNEKAKKYSSPAETISDAKKLIAKGEVSFLRASALLHNLLKSIPNAPEKAEAFYLLGLSYTRLQELALWNLQEMYFRACIIEMPHSGIAEKCYAKFKESVILGFSGSSGVHIPDDVQVQLQRLKKKAEKAKEML